MERRRPELLRRRALDDLAEVHDRDGVGDVADDREVVRDEQEAELELAREAGEQVRDLRLCRGVERGERLVEDDHRRVRGERPRDRDPLPLTARELVRVAARGAGRRGRPGSSSSAIRAGRSARVPRRSVLSASPICSPTLRRGLSEENGFWNTICSRASSRGRARRVERSHLPALEADRPGERARPSPRRRGRASTCRSRTRRRARRSGPRATSRLAPATARTGPRPRRSYSTTTSSSASAASRAARGRRGRRACGRSRGASGGTDSRQDSSAYGQRGWKAQPGRDAPRRRRRTRRSRRAGPQAPPDAAARRAALACRGAAAGRARPPGRLPRRCGLRRTPRHGRRSPRARRDRAR